MDGRPGPRAVDGPAAPVAPGVVPLLQLLLSAAGLLFLLGLFAPLLRQPPAFGLALAPVLRELLAGLSDSLLDRGSVVRSEGDESTLYIALLVMLCVAAMFAGSVLNETAPL